MQERRQRRGGEERGGKGKGGEERDGKGREKGSVNADTPMCCRSLEFSPRVSSNCCSN